MIEPREQPTTPAGAAVASSNDTRARRIMRVLLIPLICYGILVLTAMLFQRRLLYFPARLGADAAGQYAAQEGFLPWRNGAGEIIGWRMPATRSAAGSVLIVHGNAGCALDRGYLAGPIRNAIPVDVFVLEYPGYGARSGSPTLKSLLAAGIEALSLLPGDKPVYIVSESIGAGVAAHLAATWPDRVAGLLLFAPYDNLASVAQAQMPILPARWILKDRFNPAASLKQYRGPVVTVVAEADEIIPPRFAHRFHESYGGPKELRSIAGARHNDIAVQPADWWRQVFEFWRKHHVGGEGAGAHVSAN